MMPCSLPVLEQVGEWMTPHGRSGLVCKPGGQNQCRPHLPRLLPDTHPGEESRRDGALKLTDLNSLISPNQIEDQ